MSIDLSKYQIAAGAPTKEPPTKPKKPAKTPTPARPRPATPAPAPTPKTPAPDGPAREPGKSPSPNPVKPCYPCVPMPLD